MATLEESSRVLTTATVVSPATVLLATVDFMATVAITARGRLLLILRPTPLDRYLLCLTCSYHHQ